MSLMSDAMLASARTEAERQLTQTCSVVTRTFTTSVGGQSASETTTTGVACQVLEPQNTPVEGQFGGSVQTRELTPILLPAATTPDEDDKIVVGTETYEVVRADRRAFRLLTRVLCARRC